MITNIINIWKYICTTWWFVGATNFQVDPLPALLQPDCLIPGNTTLSHDVAWQDIFASIAEGACILLRTILPAGYLLLSHFIDKIYMEVSKRV